MDELIALARKHGRVLQNPYGNHLDIKLTLRGLSDLVDELPKSRDALEKEVLVVRVNRLQRQVDELTAKRNALELELYRLRQPAKGPRALAAESHAAELAQVVQVLDTDDAFTAARVAAVLCIPTARATQLLESLRSLRVVRLLPTRDGRQRGWALIGTKDHALQRIEERKNARTK
jgi:hypothetical protein